MNLNWSPVEFEHSIGIKGPNIPDLPDCCASCGDASETTVIFKFYLVGSVSWNGVRDFRWSEQWKVPVCKTCRHHIDRARRLKRRNWIGWLIGAVVIYGIWPRFEIRIIPLLAHKFWGFWLIWSHGPVAEVIRITPFSEDGSWIVQSNSRKFVSELATINFDRISSAVKNSVSTACRVGAD